MAYQLIGTISGFKGLKGEMKVKGKSAFMAERLTDNAKVYFLINQQYQSFTVKHYHENQKYPLLVLKGYDHISLVEMFKDKDIYINNDDILELPDDTYHQDELIGLKVYQNEVLKGEVVDIRNYPKDDYLVVKTGDKDVLIPFRDEFIESMDDEKIEIVDMEGLF